MSISLSSLQCFHNKPNYLNAGHKLLSAINVVGSCVFNFQENCFFFFQKTKKIKQTRILRKTLAQRSWSISIEQCKRNIYEIQLKHLQMIITIIERETMNAATDFLFWIAIFHWALKRCWNRFHVGVFVVFYLRHSFVVHQTVNNELKKKKNNRESPIIIYI